MSTYYVKQKVLSLFDRFTIKDAQGIDCYMVEGEWSLMKSLYLKDMNGVELAHIKGKLSFRPTFEIYQDGVHNATLRQEFTLFKNKLSVEGPNWDIIGNWISSEFDITDMDGGSHAHISRELMTWGDSYRIDMAPGEPEILLLAIVIAIDAVLEIQRAARS
ncbi:MAG: LURP-one-related family protein [Propionibacteriaceae bacterium]|nr:LURP-one-related family protein [Propionibacteriaceae bacterium]